ncbi:MAG: chemotaxis protein CheX [Magnetococcus sp. DMHC-8]
MITRQYERVVFESECILQLPRGVNVVCRTLDVSLGGVKVTSQTSHDLLSHLGADCVVEFPVVIPDGLPEGSAYLKTQARIVNGDDSGVGLSFRGVDQESLALLKKLVEQTLQSSDLNTLRDKDGVAVQGPHVKVLKVLLEEHIAEAVKEIFIAFLTMDVGLGPYVERPDFEEYRPPETDVTGLIRFSGDLEGGVHLAAPLHFAINAAGALLGEAGLDFTQQQDDMVWDAFAEVVNQVAGSIQTRLSGHFEDITMSAPVVTLGPPARSAYRSSLSSVRHFFGSAFGPFYVECFFA